MTSIRKWLQLSAHLRAASAALVLAGGLTFHSAAAQTPSADEKRALAMKITEISFDTVSPYKLAANFIDVYSRNFATKPDEYQRTLPLIIPIAMEEFDKIMKYTAEQTSRFYEDNFDIDELRQIKEFASSAVGLKQVRLGSEFTTRLIFTIQERIKQQTPAIEFRIKEELRKRGFKL